MLEVSVGCINEDTYGVSCVKCGECGRKFTMNGVDDSEVVDKKAKIYAECGMETDRYLTSIKLDAKKRICSCCAFYSQPTYVACRHCRGFDKFETSAKTEENSMMCNRREAIEGCLTPYIGKPVYVKGYCWGRKFDGWVVLYMDGERMSFDYRGNTYPVWGFLPSRFTMDTDSSINNVIYKEKNDAKEMEEP